MGRVPTTYIVDPDPESRRGWKIINTSDFDANRHEIYVHERPTNIASTTEPSSARAALEARATGLGMMFHADTTDAELSEAIETAQTALDAAADAANGEGSPSPDDAPEELLSERERLELRADRAGVVYRANWRNDTLLAKIETAEARA